MTLLGGGFHIGTNKKPAANIDPMDMSLGKSEDDQSNARSDKGKISGAPVSCLFRSASHFSCCCYCYFHSLYLSNDNILTSYN